MSVKPSDPADDAVACKMPEMSGSVESPIFHKGLIKIKMNSEEEKT